MMRRKTASLVATTSSIAAGLINRKQHFSDDGNNNTNKGNRRMSNFDEMMFKLKQQQQQKGGGASSGQNNASARLPTGLQQRTRQYAQQQQKPPAPKETDIRDDDDVDTFDALFNEGRQLGGGESVEKKTKQMSDASTNVNDEDADADDLYTRELKYSRQMRSENQRSEFIRQRNAVLGGSGGGGSGGADSTATFTMSDGSVGSLSFGDRSQKLKPLNFFKEDDDNINRNKANDLGGRRAQQQQQQQHPLQPLSQLKREQLTRRSFAEVEDDESFMVTDDDDGTSIGSRLKSSHELENNNDNGPSLSELTALASEMTLLDDTNFAYFMPATTSTKELGFSSSGGSKDDDAAASSSGEHHVPGTPIIPPGFTRYRVDVQYQGSDFDGWDKSTEKMRHLLYREGEEDGASLIGALQNGGGGKDKPTAGDVASSTSTPLTEVLGMKPRARRVLEDALAVALDMNHVRVHAAVMPEVGAHVKRLTCHLDIPSSIVMQPRTVVQRATAWLEQKARAANNIGGGGGGRGGAAVTMPLAILAFYPCPDQTFDARYSTTRRIYVYRILNRIAPPLFDSGLQWHVDQYLDVDRMNRFASLMVGTHDFGAFADPKLGHSLRKSLEYSGGGVGGGGGGGGGGFSRGAVGAGNKIAMRFFNNNDKSSGGSGVSTNAAAAAAQDQVSQMITAARQEQRDRTLSKRHAGYVGEDLLAEEAGSSSAVAMRTYVKDLEAEGGEGKSGLFNDAFGRKHHARKDEFKQWSPYEEQDRFKIKQAKEAKEALYVDYSPVTTRTIEKLQVVRQDDEVLIWFVGKSFLRHQIRNIVSVLKAAGQGLWDERELKHFVQRGFSPQRSDLKNKFPIAPVHGLTLWDTEHDLVVGSGAASSSFSSSSFQQQTLQQQQQQQKSSSGSRSRHTDPRFSQFMDAGRTREML